MKEKKQIEQLLIEKAMKDKAFRELLLNNPMQAIEKETGIKIPETIEVKVLKEDPRTIYLILPYIPPEGTDVELDEADFDMVAGGWSAGTAECGTCAYCN